MLKTFFGCDKHCGQGGDMLEQKAVFLASFFDE
jgi:hypothetical protein